MYLGVHKATGVKVAIKVVDKAGVKQKPEMLKNEVEILSKVEHPNVIALFDIFDTPEKLYLVMELCVTPPFGSAPLTASFLLALLSNLLLRCLVSPAASCLSAL